MIGCYLGEAPVVKRNPIDILNALRIDTEHSGWFSIVADNQVTNLDFSHELVTIWRIYLCRIPARFACAHLRLAIGHAVLTNTARQRRGSVTLGGEQSGAILTGEGFAVLSQAI